MGMVNLLVGKNNCCKTSVLESIFLLTGGGNPEVLMRVNNLRNLFFTEADDFRFVFNNLNYKTELIISGEYGDNKSRSLHIGPNDNMLAIPATKVKKNGQTDHADINTATGEPIVNQLVFKLKIKRKNAKSEEFEGTVSYSQNEFTFKPSPNYKEDQRGLFISSSTFALSGTLEKRLEKYIINKRQKEIVNVLQSIDPSILDITLGTNKIIYVDIGVEKLIPLNLLGDGIRRMLSIILGIAEVNDGVILIDEIDNGLHFTAMSSLWKAVLKASKDFNVQVFATTHNFETIQYLKLVLENPDLEPQRSNVRSYTLRKLEDGSIKSYQYDFEQLGFAIDQKIEFR